MNIKKACFIMLAIFFSQHAMSDIVVIVHPSMGSEVSQSDIERVFLGKKATLADGTKVVPYNLPPGSTEADTFNEKVLGKSASQLKAYWSKLVFTGRGTPPEELASSTAAIAKVAGDPAAIAYVDSAAVPKTVKIVATFK